MTEGPAVAREASRTRLRLGVPRGVLLVALAAVVVAGGVAGWVVHGRSRHPAAPDVAAYARSGPVREADRAYSAWISGQLAELGRTAPWLRAAGRSVADACQALPSGGAGVSGATAWTLSCQRTQDGYYAYAGGSGRSRVSDLERALAGLGWAGFTFTPAAAAAGGQPATPGVLQAGYVASQAGPAGKVGLVVSWLSPAQVRAVGDYIRFPEVVRTGTVRPIQVVPPDLTQIARAAAAKPAGRLVVVELFAEYTRPGG
jgi:hypothetical protein